MSAVVEGVGTVVGWLLVGVLVKVHVVVVVVGVVGGVYVGVGSLLVLLSTELKCLVLLRLIELLHFRVLLIIRFGRMQEAG